jgi:primosomal protein N' (replication factor Y)
MPELAQVLFNLPVEKSFTYQVPSGTPLGVRVVAPFRRRRLTGIVLGGAQAPADQDYEIREVARVVDSEPLIAEQQIELARWLSGFYLCSLGEALFAMLPGGRREVDAPALGEDYDHREGVELSEDQQSAVELMTRSGQGAFYLYGITGSGKTEVFLRVAAELVARDRGVIYLVPEIALAHQLFDELRARFGETVAVLHSGLSPSQRLAEWQRIRSGKARLVVGARSAVFAPVPALGMIVVDEEHEGSYKASSTPRYHARQVAFHRAHTEGCLLVMGSATPSVEAYHGMRSGTLRELRLRERLSGGSLPAMEVVDMKKEAGLLSRRLVEAVQQAHGRGRQAILFLNRRGFSYTFVCRSCGYEHKCRRCSVPLTYHKTKDRLVCHYCGLTDRPRTDCPECGSLDVGYAGFGTQRIEEELALTFPSLRIERVDTDSVKKGSRLGELLREFRGGGIDLLVGTQMVAKGLNFPGVQLVGIVSADTGMQLPDFRALERSFALIVQVAGRAGRMSSDGRVVVQTMRPQSAVIQYARLGEVDRFYEEEIAVRRELGYPPFARMVRLIVRGRSLEKVSATADLLARAAEAGAGALERGGDRPRALRSAPARDGGDLPGAPRDRDEGGSEQDTDGSDDGLEVLGPVECPIARIAGNHRVHLILKASRLSVCRAAARRAVRTVGRTAGAYIEIDVDPVSML